MESNPEPTPEKAADDEAIEDLDASDPDGHDVAGGRTLVLDHFVVSKDTLGDTAP